MHGSLSLSIYIYIYRIPCQVFSPGFIWPRLTGLEALRVMVGLGPACTGSRMVGPRGGCAARWWHRYPLNPIDRELEIPTSLELGELHPGDEATDLQPRQSGQATKSRAKNPIESRYDSSFVVSL